MGSLAKVFFLKVCRNSAESSRKIRFIAQRMPWGGGKRRGVENLTNDTPPKKGFWTPPPTVRFPPPQVSVLCMFFPVKKSTTEQTRSSFGGVQKFSGVCVLWYVLPPPYVLHPPISPPKLRSEILQKFRGNLRIFFCNDPFPNDPISELLSHVSGCHGFLCPENRSW